MADALVMALANQPPWPQTDCTDGAESGADDGHHLHPHARRLAVLAVMLDLFSRDVIGWSMRSRMDSDLVLSALLMMAWRRKLAQEVMEHSDQGSQLTSDVWESFMKENGLVASMSRRGQLSRQCSGRELLPVVEA